MFIIRLLPNLKAVPELTQDNMVMNEINFFNWLQKIEIQFALLESLLSILNPLKIPSCSQSGFQGFGDSNLGQG